MKKKVLIVFPLPKEGLVLLADKYELIYPEKHAFTKEEQISLIPECSAMISVFRIPVDKDIIEAGKKLEIISNYGVGYNNIDIQAAKYRGICVCNTPESVCEPTAELCLALMLSISRGISTCDKQIRSSQGVKWGIMENLGNTLRGKTLGIIGMGNIGKSIAIKAKAFGMKIAYHNRNKITETENKILNAKFLNLNEIMSTSDYISINCPLNEKTKNIISDTELRLMKKTAYIINTARGGIINEEHLIQVLKDKNIAGAALDVYENEPNINPEFIALQNTLLVPHIGTASIETRIQMAEEASENIICLLENAQFKNRVC